MHGRNREGSWLRRWRLSLAALSGLALAAGAQAQERTTKTKYVDSLNFEIPIILRENPENIRELQLWASSDQGKSWQKVKTADPARKKIRMTAQNDSEWLFTMVFVDKTGRSTPADVERAAPHLRVMVDTSKPVVNLEAMPPRNENCGVRWSIDEASPDLESLKVELRTKKDPTWFQLKNVAPRLQGEVEWPCDPGDDYEVRVTLADRAGHSAVKNIEIAGMPGESVRGSKPAPPIAAREREYDRDWMPERPGMIKRSQAMKTAQREAPVGSADLKAEPLPGRRVVNAADEG
ncbi:MAG TPA: hypothetical protein VNC50_07365, partial [Planctomycetia bacterium]|nr:hypothetical protein [Planctomycetia bacterium]